MTDTPWHPSRILVVGGIIPDLAEYLTAKRPDIEFRDRPLAQMDLADLEWAQVFVGFRRPPVPSWGNVRWIHSIGAGVDGLLAGGPIPAPIVLTRSPEDFGPAIGEWCVARALAANQHLFQHAADQAARHWNRELEPLLLAGQKVVVIGTGLVGRGIARAFRALGCPVHGLSRSGAPVPDFDSVAPIDQFGSAVRSARWLVLAAPLTRETRHFLDRERMEQCGGLYLMNVGRGPLIDEAMLPLALERGWISGVALDVFEREPLPPESPLWLHPKVMISPHVSGPSTLAATADGFLECLASFEAGEGSRWIVDPKKGY